MDESVRPPGAEKHGSRSAEELFGYSAIEYKLQSHVHLQKKNEHKNDGFAYTHLEASIFYANPNGKNSWTEKIQAID